MPSITMIRVFMDAFDTPLCPPLPLKKAIKRGSLLTFSFCCDDLDVDDDEDANVDYDGDDDVDNDDGDGDGDDDLDDDEEDNDGNTQCVFTSCSSHHHLPPTTSPTMRLPQVL